MEIKRVFDILKKSLIVFPVLVKVIGEIEDEIKKAQAPESAGGKKLSAGEVASIVASSVGKIVSAVIDVFPVVTSSSDKK